MYKFQLILFALIAVIASNYSLNAQVLNQSTPDTLTKLKPVIELSDIQVKSVELIHRTRREVSELIQEGIISELKVNSDSLIASIYRDNLGTTDFSDSTKSISFQESKIIELTQQQKKIAEQYRMMTVLIRNLEDIKIKLMQESVLWKNTLEKLEKDSTSIVIPLKLPETIAFIDTTLMLISKKNSSLMEIMDTTIVTAVEIDKQIERCRSNIRNRHSHAFNRDQLPFFQQNFNKGNFKEIFSSISASILSDLNDIKTYLKAQVFSVVLIFIIFAFLLPLFMFLGKKPLKLQQGYGYYYKEMLLNVLKNPLSASITLTLFLALLIFPDRPIIFRELSLYIVAFPLLKITSNLLDKIYHPYIKVFGVILLFYILAMIIPSEIIVYREVLLIISIAEMMLLSLFLLRTVNKLKSLHNSKKIIYFVVFLHLALALTGFMSNLTGRVTLTEIVLFAIFTNIFIGLILFNAVLMLNGLIVTGIDTKRGQKINTFRLHGEVIKRKTIALLNFIAILFFVMVILKNFLLLDSITQGIIGVFTYKIKIGSADFSLDSIVIFFSLIYIAVVFSKMMQVLFEEDILNHVSLAKGLPHTIATMIRYSIIVAGFLLAVNSVGIPLDKLSIMVGAFSVGIGFGLQNIFNNLVSGLILLFERPVKLGDTVQVGALTGNVKSIGIRSSNIHTFDGAEVIVPNGQLVSNEVVNWTLSDPKRRNEIMIGVSCKSRPIEVQKLLMEILDNNGSVLKAPAPDVFFSGLGEGTLDFAVLYWIADNMQSRRIRSELLFSIFDLFEKHNIEIPFPQREIYLRNLIKEDSPD